MPIPDNINVLAPWTRVDHPDAKKLASELNRGISAGHVLASHKIKVCARRTDRDDILLTIEDCEKPLALVHLTWRKESNPTWPATRFFSSWDHWVEAEMLPAHQELKAKS